MTDNHRPKDSEQPEGLFTALATEHFTLQGARSAIAILVSLVFNVASFVLLLGTEQGLQQESGGQQEVPFASPPADRQRLE